MLVRAAMVLLDHARDIAYAEGREDLAEELTWAINDVPDELCVAEEERR